VLRTLLALSLFASVAAADPSSKADIKADWDMVCNAPARSGGMKTNDPSERARIIATYIQSHLKTNEVRQFLSNLPSTTAPKDQPAAVKKAAKDAGYTGACPMADS
jgi:hypothetical protein